MKTTLSELTNHLDALLNPQNFKDYCPNGLQVEGRSSVSRLVTGVTASQALIDEAVKWDAHAILVHHGYFWSGEKSEVTGMKKRRLKALLTHDISLLAYHLPLDAHPQFGNNIRLGELMGFSPEQISTCEVDSLVCIADLPESISAGSMVERVNTITGRESLHIGDELDSVKTIAWCTGAAQSYLDTAIAAGADMFVTGEVSEPTVHTAREEGIHFIAAGHHATERYGVQALGQHLAEVFSLEHRFIDIDNPV